MSTFVQGHGPGADQFPKALGQTVSAASMSVVIASDYTLPVTVSSSVTNPMWVEFTDGTASYVGAKTGQLPSALGSQVKASSLSITLASDQGALAVSQSGVWNIGGIPTSLGQKTMAGSTSVTLASDQSSVPVTVGNATLAVTQSGTWAVTGLPTGLGQKTMVNSTSVAIASDQSSLPVTVGNASLAVTQSGAWNIGTLTSITNTVTVSGSVSLTGADYNVGVAGATTQRTVDAGRPSAWHVRNDYTVTNVTNGAYVQLVASTANECSQLHIFDSSGAALVLATGLSGSEIDQLYIPPGGKDAAFDLYIAAGQRVSIKSVDTATVNVGQLLVTAIQ